MARRTVGHVTDFSKPPVTVLGLGQMGSALASALVKAGYPTTVWNRTPGKAVPGSTEVSTVTEAVEASRLVVVCLLDAQSVTDVLDTATDVLPGRVLVNLTNGTPAQARDLAARYDVELLDGGIMAVPPMIGTPAAFVLYSGSRSAFDTNKPVLDVFGDSIYVGADPGFAALHDIALLTGMYGMYAGVVHALALVDSAGLPATSFAPLLVRWLAAMTGLVDGAAEQVEKRDYGIDVVSNLAMQTAVFPNFFSTTEEQGLSTELLAPLYELMRRRVADGHGHEDLPGIVELLRKDNK